MAPTRSLTLLRDGGGYYEGPRWRGDRWWISDFHRTGLFTVTENGSETLIATIPSQSSGIGWLPDKSLLIVSMKDHRLLRRTEAGALETYADLRAFARSELNDMVVSGDGHAYIGQFGFDINAHAKPEKTILILVGPDRQARVVADDLFFPNGMVITPDGKTLVVGEALGGCYTAFDIAADGGLSRRRTWAALGPMPTLGEFGETMAQLKATPDGCCLDAEGAIWCADPINRRVARVHEGGRISEEIPAPEGLYFWACMLGGADGRTLLLAAAPGFLDHGHEQGHLFTTRVDVPHAGWP